jgi:steroid delta-isomerase-like uncharacterized protein
MAQHTPDQLKDLSRRWFEEVWNKKNAAAIDQLAAPDVVCHGLAGPGGQPLRGSAGFRAFYEPFRTAFPDVRVTVEDVIVEGDKSAIRFTATGTHTGYGPSAGLAPTGRRIQATGLCLVRWQDGRIAEVWNEFDAAGMMAQLTG